MSAYRLIDTVSMPWAPMPGIPGFKRRVLHVDGRSGASVEIQYSPPGFSQGILSRLEAGAVRHFHRTVTERHYFLAGDLPNCDWKNLDDASGLLTIYRRHSFLDRPPLTLHGLLPGHVPAAGSEYLVWNTGRGTSLWEAAAKLETVEVADGDSEQWRSVPFVEPRVLQADRLPALPHPSLALWKRLVIAPPVSAVASSGPPPLARAAAPSAGTAEVALVIAPAGPLSGAALDWTTGGCDTAWLFVLGGDLALAVRTENSHEDLLLHEGGFLMFDRSGGADARAECMLSDRGCTLLTVGIDFAAH